jgi:RNA polymerase sigma factor (sigma-70 family)
MEGERLGVATAGNRLQTATEFVSVDWAEVYQSTYGELVRFLHRRVWDADRAQDLAQEAFARALGHDPENPRAWLYRIAANLANDEVRLVVRRKRHLTLLKQEAERAESAVPLASAELEQGERMERMRTLLERLSERDQTVLLLWNAGLSYAEIAEQTGLARGAVSTTLARALQRLTDANNELEGAHASPG